MEEKNFNLFFKKLISCGIEREFVETLFKNLGPKLKTASYSTRTDSGCCGEGTLIDTALFSLAASAVKLNDIFPEEMRVDKNSLVKVCLLQHISKCERYVKQFDDFRINRLGELYTYNNQVPAIGVGLHSLIMANECGITFTPLEAEAMTIIDKSDDDEQAKYHSSTLSSIVKMANEVVYIKGRETNKMHN